MPASRTTRAIGCLVGLAAIVAGAIGWLLHGSRKMPEFYAKALEADTASLRKANDEMLTRLSDLAGRLQRPGKWQAVFTAEQINGWLAVDLVENHARSLPDWLDSPRVGIEGDQLIVAAWARRWGLRSIVSLRVEPYLSQAHEVGLRIHNARAGYLPVPLQQVLDAITRALEHSELRLQWRQADGDPVALISIRPGGRGKKSVHLETLHLGEGKIYLGGVTK